MNKDECQILSKTLEKIEKELREALHRTPTTITSKQHIYNAYQMILALLDFLDDKKRDTL